MAVNRSVDLTGRRFGRLVVVEQLPSKETHNGKDAVWLTKCDCGNEVASLARQLVHGVKQSCGCLRVDRLREAIALPEGEAAFNKLINSYKYSAKKRGYVFNLEREYVRRLMISPCHYCGIEPYRTQNNIHNTGTFTYNGIDRIDNTKGYVEDNVVACCKTCNHAKDTMTYEEYRLWVRRAYNHMEKNYG